MRYLIEFAINVELCRVEERSRYVCRCISYKLILTHAPYSFSMSKQISLAQITNRTYSVQLSNIKDILLSNVLQLIKKHHGLWNPIINQYEIPIVHTSEFIRTAKELDTKIVIKDVPGANLRALLNYRGKEANSKVVYILPRHKWTRILAYDPLLTRRYEFAIDLASKKQDKSHKRVLLVFWEVMRKKWQKELIKKRVAFQNAVYYQLITPQELYKVGNITLKEPQFDLLTYQTLNDLHQNLTRSTLQKYHAVFFDDSQLWIQPENSLYKNAALGQIVRTIIINKLNPSKELLLLTSRFVLQKPQIGLQIANLLLPRSFGFDPISIAKGQANDASWMKKRYVKENGYYRQLMFIFNSMFFVNLLQSTPNQKEQAGSQSSLIVDNFHEVTLQDQDMRKFKAVDNRYKNVNKKQAITDFQSQRAIGTYVANNSSKFTQGKYIKQLRETFTVLKLPQIFKFLYHISKDLKLKTIVVVQNQWGQQKLQNFMLQQQISHVVYQITHQQLEQPQLCYCNRQNPNPSVYLIVRDKLLQQYRAANLQRQKSLEMAFQRQAQQELGIKRGGLFEINTAVNSPFSELSNVLPLKKISTAHHIIMVDTYWHDFSAEKQQIFSNIIDWKIPTFQQATANTVGRANEYGLIEDPASYLAQKRTQLVRHYFTVGNSYQLTIIQKYLLNLQAHQEELQQSEDEAVDINLKFRQLCEQKELSCVPTINEVLDIDQQFDKLEFQARKQQQQQEGDIQLSQQKPIYNTKIEGLVIETPHLDDLKKLSCSEDQKMEQELITQDKNILEALKQYEDSDEDQQEEQTSCNLDKYIIPGQICQKNTGAPIQQSSSKDNKPVLKTRNVVAKQITPTQKKIAIADCFESSEEIVPPIKELSSGISQSKKLPKEQSPKIRAELNQERQWNYRQKPLQRDLFYKSIQSISKKRNFNQRVYQSRGLWRGKVKQQKIIAKKLMKLKVMLVEGRSSMWTPSPFNEDE